MAMAQMTQPISLLQQQLTGMAVSLAGVLLVCACALLYFRRVRLDRPPIGTFNARDIGILLTIITALPFLYAAVPLWVLTAFLVIGFASSLSIGYRPLLGERRLWLLWLGIGLLIGGNIWTSRFLLGSTAGWQLWWAELSVLVTLGAVSVANLYVQGGMRLSYVTGFAVAIAVYDAVFVWAIPLTDRLVQELLGKPLDPSLGMRFGVDNYAIGIGDMLIYALFAVAAYKAYGRQAARIALGLIVIFGVCVPSLAPVLIYFVDARGDTVVPSQAFFGPAAFLCYVWFRRRYGRERTMAEYRASTDLVPGTTTPAQPVPAREPASA
jgi:hypothetical protein